MDHVDGLQAPRRGLAFGAAALIVAALAGGAAGQLTDHAISDAVDDRIGEDPAIRCEGIDVSAANGLVTLSGRVDCLSCRLRADAVAQTVRGVRAVINHLQVVPPTGRLAESVIRDVERALLYDPVTAQQEIKVQAEGGVVTLTGAANDWPHKQAAWAVASQVLGVTEVKNALLIRGRPARGDAEIEAEINQVLRWDGLVDHALIEVSVHKGLVKLSGVVASAAEFARAREDAQVAGVEIVDASPLHVERWTRDKELRRGKYAPADAAELQRAAQQALGRQPRLANFAVTVEIRGHVAILRGTVGNLYARRQAERTLRTVVGIGAITNRLKVRPAEAAEDPVIAADLRLALRRDPHLADLPLQVAASGGVARLAGTVDTYFQKARAEDLASMARGIYAVSNQVEVRQDAAAFITSPYVDEGDGRDYAWYQPQPRRIVRDDETVRAAIAEHLRWSPYINADAVQVAMHAGVATLTGSVACDTQKRAAEHSAYGGGAAWVVNELKVEHELVKSAKE